VIENVEQARDHLIDPVLICGSMFDPVMDVKRHRLFEANWPLEHPQWPCGTRSGLYRTAASTAKEEGHARRAGSRHESAWREYALSRVVGVHGHENYTGERQLREAAMGID